MNELEKRFKIIYDGKYPNACGGDLCIYDDEVLIYTSEYDYPFENRCSGYSKDTKDGYYNFGCAMRFSKKNKERTRYFKLISSYPFKEKRYIFKKVKEVLNNTDAILGCGGCD